jgi:hypothetical protein
LKRDFEASRHQDPTFKQGPNIKLEGTSGLQFKYWRLKFPCLLEIELWNFRSQGPDHTSKELDKNVVVRV